MTGHRNFCKRAPMSGRLRLFLWIVGCIFVDQPSAYSMQRLWCRDADVVIKNNAPALKFNKWFGEDANYKMAHAGLSSNDCKEYAAPPWEIFGATGIINGGFEKIRPDIPSKSPNINSGLVLYGENYDNLYQVIAPTPLAACVYRFSATIFAYSKEKHDDREFCVKFSLNFDQDGRPIVTKIDR